MCKTNSAGASPEIARGHGELKVEVGQCSDPRVQGGEDTVISLSLSLSLSLSCGQLGARGSTINSFLAWQSLLKLWVFLHTSAITCSAVSRTCAGSNFGAPGTWTELSFDAGPLYSVRLRQRGSQSTGKVSVFLLRSSE